MQKILLLEMLTDPVCTILPEFLSSVLPLPEQNCGPLLKGLQKITTLWSRSPNRTVVSDTSNVPQNVSVIALAPTVPKHKRKYVDLQSTQNNGPHTLYVGIEAIILITLEFQVHPKTMSYLLSPFMIDSSHLEGSLP